MAQKNKSANPHKKLAIYREFLELSNEEMSDNCFNISFNDYTTSKERISMYEETTNAYFSKIKSLQLIIKNKNSEIEDCHEHISQHENFIFK